MACQFALTFSFYVMLLVIDQWRGSSTLKSTTPLDLWVLRAWEASLLSEYQEALVLGVCFLIE